MWLYFFMAEDRWDSRTSLLLGEDGMSVLRQSHVLVVGLGGVGAYAAEMLCRAGVGELTLVDADNVSLTNLNRQLIALHSTLGQPKSEVLARRLTDINPDVKLHVHTLFLRDEETIKLLKAAHYSYVVDAIDTLSPKTFLIYYAVTLGIPIVSSMGAGGKFKPEEIRVSDISKSQYCHLARAVRKKLHHLGIKKGVTTVYSPEPVRLSCLMTNENEPNKLTSPGTISYMPALFGCHIAAHIIQSLTSKTHFSEDLNAS
ncbi:MAG: tRNA threonylcarbamoyladenosine dehydratase [Bacteroidales bacterium]|nr:tRNA threonylcarbamoyladenosine dehydratase [Bacteroidales bacterium]